MGEMILPQQSNFWYYPVRWSVWVAEMAASSSIHPDTMIPHQEWNSGVPDFLCL